MPFEAKHFDMRKFAVDEECETLAREKMKEEDKRMEEKEKREEEEGNRKDEE